MTQQIITTAKKLEKPVTLYILSGFLVMFVMVYIYLINGTVMNVVERNSAELSIADISSDISELESNYLNLENSIDVALANSLGFKEIKSDSVYVSVNSSVASLSFNSGI